MKFGHSVPTRYPHRIPMTATITPGIDPVIKVRAPADDELREPGIAPGLVVVEERLFGEVIGASRARDTAWPSRRSRRRLPDKAARRRRCRATSPARSRPSSPGCRKVSQRKAPGAISAMAFIVNPVKPRVGFISTGASSAMCILLFVSAQNWFVEFPAPGTTQPPQTAAMPSPPRHQHARYGMDLQRKQAGQQDWNSAQQPDKAGLRSPHWPHPILPLQIAPVAAPLPPPAAIWGPRWARARTSSPPPWCSGR